MRIFLSFVVLLSGLLVVRELMLGYNELLRPTFHGAKIISEQEIASLHEPPALTARVAVASIGELSAQTLAILPEPPPLAARTPVIQLAEVSEQSIAAVGEPPTLATRIPVALAAQVAEQSLDPAGPRYVAPIGMSDHRHPAGTASAGQTDTSRTGSASRRAEHRHCARTASSGRIDRGCSRSGSLR